MLEERELYLIENGMKGKLIVEQEPGITLSKLCRHYGVSVSNVALYMKITTHGLYARHRKFPEGVEIMVRGFASLKGRMWV